MTVLIGGTFRLPPEAVERFRPHMETMLAKSRAEDGCLTYSYAFDVLEPGLVRVFEAWRDQAAALHGDRDLLRIDASAHDPFAQPRGRVDQDAVPAPGARIA